MEDLNLVARALSVVIPVVPSNEAAITATIAIYLKFMFCQVLAHYPYVS
jgi:hypothetical protein